MILALALLAVSLVCAGGCADSQAPAMTQVAKSPTESAESSPAADTTASPAVASASPAAEAKADAKEGSPLGATPQEPVAANASKKPPTELAASSAAPDRVRDISFDDLKFDIEKGDRFERSLLTDKIEALDGKRVRIRGFILPSFQQTGLTQFVLVRDNLSCCFGPGAAIYDCVIVEMKPGHSTDYSLYPVAVDGTFTIHEMLDPEGKAVAIYHLDGEQVR